MSRPAPSYVSGPSTEPLLGQTLWQALVSAALAGLGFSAKDYNVGR